MRISPVEIILKHPHSLMCPTDEYYANLATKLFNASRDTILGKVLGQYNRKELAINMAMYAEDIIAELGFWRSFVEQHQALYGKPLPFHEVTDYEADIPHSEDIQVLIWLMLTESDIEHSYNPISPSIQDLASIFLRIIDKAFDNGPENTVLADYIHHARFMDDYLNMRDMMDFMQSSCYLTHSNSDEYLEKEIKLSEDIFGSKCEEHNSFDPIYYTAKCNSVFSIKTGPLALYPKQWLSNLMRTNGQHAAAQRIDDIQYKPISYYHIEKYDDRAITIKDVDDNVFELDRSSFGDNIGNALANSKIYVGAAVCFDGVWSANGLSSWPNNEQPFNELKQRHQTDKQRYQKYDFNPIVKKFDGRQLFYFATPEDCNHFLVQLGFPDLQKTDELTDIDNVALFINPDTSNIAVIYNCAEAIRDVQNPYYNPDIAFEIASEVISETDYVSDELVHYLLRHNMLPDASFLDSDKYDGLRLMQDNIDFYARATRQNYY